jgi:hypothetical protein
MERVTLHGETFFVVHPVDRLMSSHMVREVVESGARFVVNARTSELTIDRSAVKQNASISVTEDIYKRLEVLTKQFQSALNELAEIRKEISLLKR